MSRARFEPDARIEYLLQITHYRRVAGPRVSKNFTEAVSRTIDFILDFPDAGSPIRRGIRRTPVRGFPISICYLPTEDGISVIAVAHDARGPDYWRRRLIDDEHDRPRDAPGSEAPK